MTPNDLAQAIGARLDRATENLPWLADAMDAYAINTPRRQAAFLAQLGHESGGLKWINEIWGPTAAQSRYEGRKDLGNVQPGDGYRYRGRGWIQLTGRDNYKRATQRLRARFPDCPDFEQSPDLVATAKWAALTAADFWNNAGLNALADAGKFELITRRINGGLNGYPDRLARWETAKAVLSKDAEIPTVATISTPQEAPMLPLLPAIISAFLPNLIEAIPKLAEIFPPGSETAQRNVKAATIAFDVAKKTLNAANEQEVVEQLKNNPAAVAAVTEAIENNWFALKESGSGGMDGARKADAATAARGDMLQSPSFWVALALLPLVYMIAGTVAGFWGSPFSEDVRSAIANGLVGMIIGSLAGYYFGQMTSRNRTTTSGS